MPTCQMYVYSTIGPPVTICVFVISHCGFKDRSLVGLFLFLVIAYFYLLSHNTMDVTHNSVRDKMT